MLYMFKLPEPNFLLFSGFFSHIRELALPVSVGAGYCRICLFLSGLFFNDYVAGNINKFEINLIEQRQSKCGRKEAGIENLRKVNIFKEQ